MIAVIGSFLWKLSALLGSLFRPQQQIEDYIEGEYEIVEDEPPSILIGDVVDRESGQSLPLVLPAEMLHAHALFSGQTQMGKSREAGGLLLQKIANGEQVIVIDPHGNLHGLMLENLIEGGYLDSDQDRDTILFFDLPGSCAQGLYPSFDILQQWLSPYATAEGVLDSFHRVWPELTAAPAFDVVVLHGTALLAYSKLPITELGEVLTKKPLRDNLLRKANDQKLTAFFHDYFDELDKRQRQETVASTMRRASRLTFSPDLSYPLSSATDYNLANMRALLEQGKSVIINIKFDNDLTTRIWGSFLLTIIERAALARLNANAKSKRQVTVFVDEFGLFVEKAEGTINTFLQRTAGAGVSVWLCHQNISSIPETTLGALDNAAFRVSFQLGERDALYFSPYFYDYDSRMVKDVIYGSGQPRVSFYSPTEQASGNAVRFTSLKKREAIVRLPDGRVYEIETPDILYPVASPRKVAEISQYYRDKLYRPKEDIEAEQEQRLITTMGVSQSEEAIEEPIQPKPVVPKVDDAMKNHAPPAPAAPSAPPPDDDEDEDAIFRIPGKI